MNKKKTTKIKGIKMRKKNIYIKQIDYKRNQERKRKKKKTQQIVDPFNVFAKRISFYVICALYGE